MITYLPKNSSVCLTQIFKGILITKKRCMGVVRLKAVIMAGGEGSRLRPLTCTMPKPMTRLCGKPVLEYILDLLISAGFEKATLTLGYMPNLITSAFPDERYGNMELEFIIEDEPMGTAGGVRNALGAPDESVLVISGDAMCDYDLKGVMDYHRQKNAAVTIVCSQVEDPREYGLLRLDGDDRVEGFVEKPAWGQACCDLANTGIYIIEPECLELIPENTKYDFAGDLFPRLLENRANVFGCKAQGYWCDIGDLDSYRRCQNDMLCGNVKWSAQQPAQGVFTRTALPKGDFVIVPPVYIGDRVQIESGAVIGPGTVVDDGCLVGAGSKLYESVVLENCYISSGCSVNRAVLAPCVCVKRSAAMYEGSAAGAGAMIGENARVNAGVLIWPKKELAAGSIASQNIKYGTCSKTFLVDDGLYGDFGVELTPERAAALGSAVASLAHKARVGIGTDGAVNSEALRYGLLGGLVSCGARVWDFGVCFEAQMYFYTAFCGLETGVFVSGGDSGAAIRLCDKGGLSVSRQRQRELEDRLARSRYNRLTGDGCRSVTDMQSVNMMYMRELCNQARVKLAGTEVTYICSNRRINECMQSAMERLGCVRGNEQLVMRINDSGTRVTAFENGQGFSFEKLLAIAAYSELKNGSDVALPWDAPQIITHLAGTLGRRVLRYADNPAHESDEQAREAGVKQLWARDACFLSVRILSALKEKGKSLKELAAQLPEFYVAKRDVGIDVSAAKLSGRLSGDGFTAAPSEGLELKNELGYAKVKPCSDGSALRIITEALTFEAAQELCADVEEIIKALSIDISGK